MITTQIRQQLPVGDWQLDPVHSSIAFEVDYMVGTFRGTFADVSATLDVTDEDVTLGGSARVESIAVKDENLAAHLLSPEFFDAERFPELTFHSNDVAVEGDRLVVRGEITIKGVTKPVELVGTASEALVDPFGRERVGLELTTTVDRTAFGLNWNAPLPTGEPALANEVRLAAELYFVKA